MPFVNFGGIAAHISVGGPVHTIQVNGKLHHFEMHPYCGPMPCNKRGDGISGEKPMAFWEAVSFWAKQGKRIENGLCVWERTFEPEPIQKHLGGRHWEIVGWKPAKPPEKGE